MENLPAIAGQGGLSAATALNPYTAALGLAQPIFQGIMGIAQNARANKIMNQAVRPTAVVPQALLESQRMYNNRVMSGMMPGQQYMSDQIAGNQAAAIRSATGMGGGVNSRIGAILGAQAQADNSYANLAAQQAQYQMQQQAALGNVLGQVGQEQNRVWQYNEAEPYAALMAAAQREKDAGNRNIYGALGAAGGAIASAITSPQIAAQAMAGQTDPSKFASQGVINAMQNPVIGKDGQKTIDFQSGIGSQWDALGSNYANSLPPMRDFQSMMPEIPTSYEKQIPLFRREMNQLQQGAAEFLVNPRVRKSTMGSYNSSDLSRSPAIMPLLQKSNMQMYATPGMEDDLKFRGY